MDAERNSLRRHVVTAALLCAVASSGHALASGPATAEAVDPSYPAARGHEAPWLEPIERSHPIRRMSSLKSEYRRIRELRRTQIQSEYERRVAEGEVDIYPRLSPTSEWDVAAGHAVIVAAGGKVTDSHGHPLHFGLGRENFLVPEFIAWGDPAAA